VRGRNIFAVIARLDRATQYSETFVMESKGHGILGPRFRGDDGFLWRGGVLHTHELRRLVLVAMAAAAVRFSTPSLA
jgi:hypothetical protein